MQVMKIDGSIWQGTNQTIVEAGAEEEEAGVAPPATLRGAGQQGGGGCTETGAAGGTAITVHCSASLWRSGTSMPPALLPRNARTCAGKASVIPKP